mmetsp:Transcript_123433/g.214033  ORF Transcript_123433/g.214033 Transcript_123433/m.214033 type:complete len:219 (-) Transcript_123433:106-762(-)
MPLHISWMNLVPTCLISTSSFFAADFITQQLEFLYLRHLSEVQSRVVDKTKPIERAEELTWSVPRTFSFAFSGMICGFYQDVWCQVLDSWLPGAGLKVAVVKTLVDSAMNVFYIGIMLVINTFLAGASVTDALQTRFCNMFAAYLVVDIPVDMVVFAWVPLKWQGLVQTLIEMFVTVLMSHCAYRDVELPLSVRDHTNQDPGSPQKLKWIEDDWVGRE